MRQKGTIQVILIYALAGIIIAGVVSAIFILPKRDTQLAQISQPLIENSEEENTDIQGSNQLECPECPGCPTCPIVECPEVAGEPMIITKEVPVEKIVEKIVEVPKEVVREVVVEKIVEVDVPRDVIVEKRVEVPVEKIVYVEVPQECPTRECPTCPECPPEPTADELLRQEKIDELEEIDNEILRLRIEMNDKIRAVYERAGSSSGFQAAQEAGIRKEYGLLIDDLQFERQAIDNWLRYH